MSLKQAFHKNDADKGRDELLEELEALRGYYSRLRDVVGRYERAAGKKDLFRSLYDLEGRKDSVEALCDELRERQNEIDFQSEELEVQNEELRAQLEELNARADDAARISEALRESEERFRALIQNSSDIIRILDREGRIIFDSPSSEKILGYPAGVTLGKSTFDYIHPDDRERVRDELNKVYARTNLGRPTEFRIRKVNGDYLDVESIGTNMFGVPGVDGMVINTRPITERKRAGEALRESEGRLLLAQQVAHVGTFEWNIQTGVNTWTPELEAMYGLPKGGFPGTQPAWEQLIYHEDRAEAVRQVSQALEKGDFEGEWRVVWPDGTVRWLHGKGWVFKDDIGKPLRLIGVNTDITERKQMEEELGKSRDELEEKVRERTLELEKVNVELETRVQERNVAEERARLAYAYNRSLIEASLDPLVTISPDGKVTDANKATEAVTGHPKGRLIGTDFSSYFTEPEKAKEGYLVAFKEGSVKDYPLEIRHRDGHTTPVIYNASVYSDETGKVIGVFAAARDITVLKKTEDARLRLAAIVDSSDDAIIGKTLDGIIMSWNAGAMRLYGYSEDEVLGKPVSIFTTPDHPDEIPRILEKIKYGEHIEHYETMRKRKDGSIVSVSLSVSPIKDTDGRVVGASTIARDVTEKKRAEETIRLASAYNRSLIEASLDPLVTISPEGKVTDVNKATERVTGFSRDWLIGTDFSNYFSDSGKAKEGYLQAFTEGTVKDYPLEIRHSDGHLTPVLYNASVYRDEAGKVIGVFAAARDITERRLMEEALRKSRDELEVTVEQRTAALREARDYLESLINYANAPIIVWDPAFTITQFNHAFERLSGYEAYEVIDKNLKILFPPESVDESLEKIEDTLAGDRWESVEIPILRKDGSTRIALWNSANIQDEKGGLLATIAQGQDITDRKDAESELAKAKMLVELYLDLMGHDINNYNQVALGYLELLNGMLHDQELIALAVKPVEAIASSSRLIENVRKLQKASTGEFKAHAVDLDEVLSELQAQHSEVPGKVTGVQYSHDQDCVVMANGLIKDVFSNLISNAIKHSIGHGPIEVAIRLTKTDDHGKKFCRVDIEDNGPGIPDAVKSKLFHRFQRGNTKAHGKGLGLYLVRTLVEDYHGTVWVEDRIKGDHTKGARFVVLLPAVEK